MIHRVVGSDGTKRLIMWPGPSPARLAVSEDAGFSWSQLKPIGDWSGIVVMGFVEAFRTGRGHYVAPFHDDGRFFSKEKAPSIFTLYQTFSRYRGLT